MDEGIRTLFRTRDDAVHSRDEELFLSTQLSGTSFGSPDGYFSINEMTSEILGVHEESADECVVFVRETYRPTGKRPRSSFLIYFLASTRAGWKVYRVR